MVEKDKHRKQFCLQRVSDPSSLLSPQKEPTEIKRKRVKARVRPKRGKSGQDAETSFDEDEASNNLDRDGLIGTPLDPINETEDDHSPNLDRNIRPRFE